jgi:hypothetical protein
MDYPYLGFIEAVNRYQPTAETITTIYFDRN